MKSLFSITLENNGKIRPRHDRENAFVGASGGGNGTGVEPSLARNPLIYNNRLFRSMLSEDFGGRHRTDLFRSNGILPQQNEAVPVQQVLDIAKRQREADVQRHRQTDDFR